MGKLLEFYNNNPEKWTKGALAKNKDGLSVPLDADSACSFCLYGAMMKICINSHSLTTLEEMGIKIMCALADEFPKRIMQDAISFNDDYQTDFARLQKFLKKYDL